MWVACQGFNDSCHKKSSIIFIISGLIAEALLVLLYVYNTVQCVELTYGVKTTFIFSISLEGHAFITQLIILILVFPLMWFIMHFFTSHKICACTNVTRFYRTEPNRTSGKIKLTPPVDSYTIVLQVLTLGTTQTTRGWF